MTVLEEEKGFSTALQPEDVPLKPLGPEDVPGQLSDSKRASPEGGSRALLAFCFVGLQISYLTWGYVQEKVMTTEYGESGRFPSATFCVFSNRVLAIILSFCLMVQRHRTARVPAPAWIFAPCSISNSLSSYGQYESLHYVSFPLQTLSKSTKVIPVMIMGKVPQPSPRVQYTSAQSPEDPWPLATAPKIAPWLFLRTLPPPTQGAQ